MPKFLQPATLQQALEMLEAEQGVRMLAGGTDLIVQMRDKVLQPQALMDVKKIPELNVFGYTGEGLEIGGAVTCNRILHADFLRPGHDVLQQAAGTLANTLLRNRATLIGNICNASPGGDMIPACLVLEGKLITASKSGGRQIPLAEFFTGPKRHVLQAGEIVVKILLTGKTGRGVYRKRQRIRGHDLAQVGVAGFYGEDGMLNLALGAVGPVPIALCGMGPFSENDIKVRREGLIMGAEDAASPITDVRSTKEYRMAMVRYLTGQVLDEFSGAAKEVAPA